MDIIKIIITISIIVAIFIYLKKYTLYRCPHCQSKHIYKMKGRLDDDGKQIYHCYTCEQEYVNKHGRL